MKLLELREPGFSDVFDDIDPGRVDIALQLQGGGAELAFGPERFDSEIFGLTIGRILGLRASSPEGYAALLAALAARARAAGYDQVLRRVSAASHREIWSLGHAGFELMDIGLTFSRTFTRPIDGTAYADLVVRPSTDADIERIAAAMLEQPWGSRYEADPSYDPADVRRLRERWLWNSHRGRAAVVLVGEVEGHAAGYATCVIDARSGHGDIELVGTLPQFRGRRIGLRLIEHAVAWFSTRTPKVTVRTQATNFAAAALYEKSGFTLDFSDLTFRLSLTTVPTI